MSGQTEILSLVSMLRPYQSVFRKLRAGSRGDGGYVLPDDLEGIGGMISLGIGDNVSFDQHFADRGVPIYQFDHTVEGPPVAHEHFHFNKTAWAAVDGPEGMTLDSILDRYNLRQRDDLLLKFDTEGAEWMCIPGLSVDTLRHFRLIVCELHFLSNVLTPEFVHAYRSTMNLLTRNHTVVHLHANNCCGIGVIEGVPVPSVVEVTFLRNDRSTFIPSREPIPGPLDYPNIQELPDLVLNPFA